MLNALSRAVKGAGANNKYIYYMVRVKKRPELSTFLHVHLQQTYT